MWTKSQNDNAVQPNALEYVGNHVIIRRDFHLVEATDEIPAHYEYEEWQMTTQQYEVYKNFETLINEQSDALIELAGIISEVG
jgi:hypothetical protein